MRILLALLPCALGEIVLSNQWREQHCVGDMRTRSLVVATATDSPNLLPILAVINSTLTHAVDGDVSHVVITRHVRRLHAAVAKFTPTAQVTICGGFSDLLTQRPPLDKLQRLADTQRVRRKELLSPFNFAAFYLPYVLREASRVLYLDTDAVVEADVTMLRTLDMGGAPAAAVEDCTQKVHKYVNYELLEEKDHHKLGGEKHWSRFGLSDAAYSNETCVFNRGVVLFDSARWRELRLTETIEDLVDAFVSTRAKLWRGGISQPPFLLTLAGRYLKLGVEWNVRGLGRLELGRAEWLLLAEVSDAVYELSLNLMWSRRWRLHEITPPRRRRCGRTRVHASRECTEAGSRRCLCHTGRLSKVRHAGFRRPHRTSRALPPHVQPLRVALRGAREDPALQRRRARAASDFNFAPSTR